jgi:hypothetical protein
VMEGRTDGGDYEHRGEYLAIEPPSLLSFTWISKATDHKPTVVTIEFHERGTGTELVLNASAVWSGLSSGKKWPAICEARHELSRCRASLPRSSIEWMPLAHVQAGLGHRAEGSSSKGRRGGGRLARYEHTASVSAARRSHDA